MKLLVYIMIYLGSALMVYNIVRYLGFTKKMGWLLKNVRNRILLYAPLVLLSLFLAGYLLVGILGKPDLLVAGILFGGSIFVSLILILIYGITDRVKAHEAQLEEINRELQEQNRKLSEAREESRSKTIFFSHMSHDIRTPMNAIIGYTQLAGKEGLPVETIREYLEKIHASGRQLLHLINDVLEMSRIESGKMELMPEPVCLCEIMQEVKDMFAPQMAEKGLSFTVDGGGVTDRCVLCDRNRLNRILLNLVSNAYKFTPEGGSVEAVLREMGRNGDLASYEIHVKDTGIGMSPEFVEKVFDAYERERYTGAEQIQGTGLGMAITKSIVELMGGEIRVISAKGQGSEFIVSVDFPVLDESLCRSTETVERSGRQGEGVCPKEGQAKEEIEDQKKKEPDFHGKRLLLAEDNPINREIAQLVLTELGFELEMKENGQEALLRLQEAGPGYFDGVLMDMQMPVMNGYEATRAIRQLPDPALAQIPVIAMTANAFQEDKDREAEAGMTAHLSKPLDFQEMKWVLAECLGLN